MLSTSSLFCVVEFSGRELPSETSECDFKCFSLGYKFRFDISAPRNVSGKVLVCILAIVGPLVGVCFGPKLSYIELNSCIAAEEIALCDSINERALSTSVV